jgi:membrane protease YdiL (CAAX protease family)
VPAPPPPAAGPPLEPARAPPPARPRVLVATWGAAIGGLAVAKLASLVEPTGVLAANLAGVAAFLFIALPDAWLRRNGEGWEAYGLPGGRLSDPATWKGWARGARDGLLVSAVVLPLFGAAFWAYATLLPALPSGLAEALAPYAGDTDLAFRLPDRFLVRVLVQLLVVALPEELFYRGWMQTSWARAEPARGVTVLGARLGAGFLRTQLLFAAGHLVVLQPWRLATFFPGLLFGWVRERTGSVAAPVVVHALANLFIATLEASFYG